MNVQFISMPRNIDGEPGDNIVIVNIDQHATAELVNKVARNFKDQFPNHHVVVVDIGTQHAVL